MGIENLNAPFDPVANPAGNPLLGTDSTETAPAQAQSTAQPISYQPTVPSAQQILSQPQSVQPLSEAPDAVNNRISGSFAQKIAQAADKLGIPSGPGGWAKSLVGGVMSALSGASAVGDVPAGAGWLYGASKAASAMAQQRQEQADRAAKQAQQDKINQREDARLQLAQNEDARAAQSEDMNRRVSEFKLIEAQKMAHRADEDYLDKIGNDGKAFLKSYEGQQQLQKPEHVFDDWTQQQMTEKGYPSTNRDGWIVKPTGTVRGDDGRLVSTYSGIKTDGPYTFNDPNIIKQINDQNITDKPLQLGQTMGAQQANLLFTQAAAQEATKAAIQHQRVQQGQQELNDKNLELVAQYEPHFDRMLAAFGSTGHPIETTWKALNDGKHPEEAQAFVTRFAGKEESGEKGLQDAIQKEKDSLAKRTEEYANAAKATKAAKGSPEGTANGNVSLKGQDYINSISDPGVRSIVQQIGQGKIEINRADTFLRTRPDILADLGYAYPGADFSTGKIKAWNKAQQEFSTGKEGNTMAAANRMLYSLNEAYDLSDPGALLNPTNQKSLEQAGRIIGNEMGSAISQGNQADQKTADDLAKAAVPESRASFWGYAGTAASQGYNLDLASRNARKAQANAAKQMVEARNARMQQWIDSAPAKGFLTPLPSDLSAQSLQIIKKVTGENPKLLGLDGVEHEWVPPTEQQNTGVTRTAPEEAIPNSPSSRGPDASQTQLKPVMVKTPGGPKFFPSEQAAAAFRQKYNLPQ